MSSLMSMDCLRNILPINYSNMQKLSTEVQFLISASYHINTFAAAIAELVYNSLDANSTSIAIRVNLHDGNIQVVDNGCGIRRNDFDLLGQRFTTSRLDNISDLKIAPSVYGFRGLALATIIEVCNEATITSRFQNSQETYMKSFCKGENKDIFKTANRPSQGTTTDIKGLLYNLKIQRKAIETNSELMAVKVFLEQLSLVHVNVSFSLRDNCKNDILFQIHKNRDVYTTLSSSFDIVPSDFQELQVEKKEYKVQAFIGKRNVESKNYQWIYLNKKYIPASKMHSIINNNLIKILRIQKKKNTKMFNSQEKNCNQDLPFYFLFISCPTFDYDINFNIKSSSIAFKNWDQITNLLEKLVQCYSGDIKLNIITDKIYQHTLGPKHNTREEVKKIMEKIMVKNTRKQKETQLQHGAKGKDIRRKIINNVKQVENNKIKGYKRSPSLQQHNKSFIEKKTEKFNNSEIQAKHTKRESEKLKQSNLRNADIRTPFMNKFICPSESLKKKCEMLSQAARRLTHPTNRTNYSPIMASAEKLENANVSTIIPYDPKQKQFEKCNSYANEQLINVSYSKNAVMSTYDLVHTILTNEINNNINNNNEYNADVETKAQSLEPLELSNNKTMFSTRLTYESHDYKMAKRCGRRLIISNDSRKKIQDNRVSYYNLNTKNKFKRSNQLKKTSILKMLKLGANQSLHTIDVSSSINRLNYNKSNIQHNIWNISNNSFRSIDNTFIEDVKRSFAKYSVDTDLDFPDANANFNIELDVTYNIQLTRNDAFTTCLHNGNQNIENSSIINSDGIIVMPYQIRHHSNGCSPRDDKCNSLAFSQIGNDPDEVDPLKMCEPILNTNGGGYEIRETNAITSKNDSLFNGSKIQNGSMEITGINGITPDVTSHHFHSLLTEDMNLIFLDTFNADSSNHSAKVPNNNEGGNGNNSNPFIIQRRCNFMPKGMSPITKNCNTKVFNSIQDDYYDDAIYKKFAESVLETAQIFERDAQDVNELTTRDTNKVNSKAKRDGADLIFNSESIRRGRVLGQVDSKYIATKMQGKTATSQRCSDFLVFFDQHAVHERIRLENNLSDYFDGTTWKTENVNAISFKISKDDEVFLHNYKDRLTRYGLKWRVDDSVITMYGIPKAIMGNHSRQVDVILKAVKSLMSELIESLKFLKGNIPLYPRTIMNLVFSEACRYAIMFGDKLSKTNCVELLQSLSECHTPFQCAHGRPAMAVIMELNENKPEYKINFEKIKKRIRERIINNVSVK